MREKEEIDNPVILIVNRSQYLYPSYYKWIGQPQMIND